MTMDIRSPFTIPEEDITRLEQNEGFRIVRTHLLNQENPSFCLIHTPLPTSTKHTFTLHRDIVHSLLLPLLQIRSRAALSAARIISHQLRTRQPRSPSSTSTSPRSIVDLELAFRGSARGAFSWLQCFIIEEKDWCSMKGCPACVVLKALHSEPFIRIVVASCRLSKYLRDILERNGGEQQQQDENTCDAKKKTMTMGVEASAAATAALPDFSFWLNAVHRAVSEDDFWGLHFWEDIEARAEDLEMGVKELIRQCCDLSSFSSRQTSSTSPTAGTPPPQQQQGSYYQTRRAVSSTLPADRESAGMPHTVVPSQTQSLKQQQQQPPQLPASGLVKSNTCLTKRLHAEEQAWMRKVIEACWVMLTREAMMGGKRRMDARGSTEAAVGMLRPAGAAAFRCRSLTT